MKRSELKQIIKEEIQKVLNEKTSNVKLLNENIILDIILGIAAAGAVGSGAAIAYDNIKYGPISKVIEKVKDKFTDLEFNKNVKPILLRFRNDQILQDKLRKGDNDEIINYIQSKLQPKELKYLKSLVTAFSFIDYRKSDKLEKL